MKMSFNNVFINFHSHEPNENSLSCINHNMFLTRHLHVVIYSYWTVVLHFSSSISMIFLLLKVYGWKKSFQDSYSSSEIFQRHFHLLKSLSNNISSLTMMFWKYFPSWYVFQWYFFVLKNLLENDVRLQECF